MLAHLKYHAFCKIGGKYGLAWMDACEPGLTQLATQLHTKIEARHAWLLALLLTDKHCAACAALCSGFGADFRSFFCTK